MFQSIGAIFRSIETRKTCFFFKRSECLFQKVLFQKISTFSLSLTWLRLHQRFFVVFFREFLQGFCPSRPVSLFCPSYCILFHVFMHFSCIVLRIFGTFYILGFLMIQTCFGKIDQWVFVLGCYNHDSCSLI